MHLSYCTNVHPAQDLPGVLDQLDRWAGPVRQAAGREVLGVGLWLPAGLAAQLAASAPDRGKLREALQRNGLELRTINAFPYAAFHDAVVKLEVYRPDWTDPARLAYTVDCATVLADLLPEGADGSISTLPLGWRTDWDAERDTLAEAALVELCRQLTDLRARTGRTVRIAVEPEPGCILDSVDDVVGWLAPRIGPGRIDPDLVGICLDTCHLAVSFADPAGAVAAIADAGLTVVKIQASAALQVNRPDDPVARAAITSFIEPRYLHQVRELSTDGTVLAVDDLPQALAELPGEGPWRVHFHVPLHHVPQWPLRSTTEVLRAAVEAVLALPGSGQVHLDVETYTWSVLPNTARPTDDAELIAGLAAEITWAADHLMSDLVPLAHRAGRSHP